MNKWTGCEEESALEHVFEMQLGRELRSQLLTNWTARKCSEKNKVVEVKQIGDIRSKILSVSRSVKDLSSGTVFDF